MLYFNLERPNLTLKTTPFEAVQQQTDVKDPHFMLFPPLVLDEFPIFGPQLLSVNDVSDEVKRPDESTLRAIEETLEAVMLVALCNLRSTRCLGEWSGRRARSRGSMTSLPVKDNMRCENRPEGSPRERQRILL
jgi:hypothetical protein